MSVMRLLQSGLMPALAASPVANSLAAHALYQTHKSHRKVAEILGVSPMTAWRLVRETSVDPADAQLASKTVADKLLVSASMCADAFIEQAYDGKLEQQEPLALAKTASILLQSAGAYAALSGAKDTLSQFVDDFGLSPTHTSSKLTLTKTVTIEQSQGNEPKVINGL